MPGIAATIHPTVHLILSQLNCNYLQTANHASSKNSGVFYVSEQTNPRETVDARNQSCSLNAKNPSGVG